MRNDIQALRGVAVLLVVLYHAGIGPFAAGYLGVDIFFVISGYLITGLISRAIERGDFSFAEFYFRRAKRLLPAAYVTILITIIVSGFFLTGPEMRDFKAQVIGALTFTANIVLWTQTGYFEGAGQAGSCSCSAACRWIQYWTLPRTPQQRQDDAGRAVKL